MPLGEGVGSVKRSAEGCRLNLALLWPSPTHVPTSEWLTIDRRAIARRDDCAWPSVVEDEDMNCREHTKPLPLQTSAPLAGVALSIVETPVARRDTA